MYGYYAAFGLFAGDPLDNESGREHELGKKPYADPYFFNHRS
jgi:hypothetical protein